MIRAGIVGVTGYSGEELVEVLLRNPEVEITCVTSRVDKPMKYSDMFPRYTSRTDVICRNLDVDEVARECDVVFVALPHTVAMGIAPKLLKSGKKVIDLSADYRLPVELYEKWYKTAHLDKENIKNAVYGLPELNRDRIKKAAFIANPGCYPTSVNLGLLPVIKHVAKSGADVIVDSKSGTTGAGRKSSNPLLFSEIDENFKSYKANAHQHIPEMETVLSGAAGAAVQINFVPHLLPVRRGILSTIYVPHKGLPAEADIHGLYREYYENEPFVRVRPLGSEMPALLDVVGTNYCDIGIKVARGMLIVVSVIDNLLKGASGQATQNMNIMFGLDEKAGLI